MSGDTPKRNTTISYRDSGVDIDAGNALVQAIKPLVKATRRSGADADLGGFGGLFDLKSWLTLDEAAKCLSQRRGDAVSEADLLRLALDGRLVLSARFVNGTSARRGRLASRAQAAEKPWAASAAKPCYCSRSPRPYL